MPIALQLPPVDSTPSRRPRPDRPGADARQVYPAQLGRPERLPPACAATAAAVARLEAELAAEKDRRAGAEAALQAAYARNDELAARIARQAAAGSAHPSTALAEPRPGTALERPRAAAAQAEVDAGNAPSFLRSCCEIVETGLRLFPLFDLVMLALRVLRIAYVEARYGVERALHAGGLVAAEPRAPHVDWQQELTRVLVDVAGVLTSPLFGGVALVGSAGHAALNVSSTDPANEGMGLRGGTSDIAGGWAQELFDGKDARYPDGEVHPLRHVRSGLRELLAETLERAEPLAASPAGPPRALEPAFET